MTTTCRRSIGRPAMLAATVAVTVAVAASLAGPMAAPAAAQVGPPPDYYDYPLSWQGLYAGVHLGYGEADAAEGLAGGLQIGYNWQVGRVVYGLEADFTWSDIGYSESYTDCGATACISARLETSLDWLATVRLRAGYLLQPGLLPYVTGGFGLVRRSSSATFAVPGFEVDAFASDDTDVSFVYGFGLESRLGAGTLLRIEYLAFSDGELDVIRAGLGFRLGN